MIPHIISLMIELNHWQCRPGFQNGQRRQGHFPSRFLAWSFGARPSCICRGDDQTRVFGLPFTAVSVHRFFVSTVRSSILRPPAVTATLGLRLGTAAALSRVNAIPLGSPRGGSGIAPLGQKALRAPRTGWRRRRGGEQHAAGTFGPTITVYTPSTSPPTSTPSSTCSSASPPARRSRESASKRVLRSRIGFELPLRHSSHAAISNTGTQKK